MTPLASVYDIHISTVTIIIRESDTICIKTCATLILLVIMGRYRVEYDKMGCIGAAVCEAQDPANWKIGPDGKAILVDGAEKEHEIFVKETDDLTEAMKEAAKGCPALVIKVIDTHTGEQLAP